MLKPVIQTETCKPAPVQLTMRFFLLRQLLQLCYGTGNGRRGKYAFVDMA